MNRKFALQRTAIVSFALIVSFLAGDLDASAHGNNYRGDNNRRGQDYSNSHYDRDYDKRDDEAKETKIKDYEINVDTIYIATMRNNLTDKKKKYIVINTVPDYKDIKADSVIDYNALNKDGKFVTLFRFEYDGVHQAAVVPVNDNYSFEGMQAFSETYGYTSDVIMLSVLWEDYYFDLNPNTDKPYVPEYKPRSRRDK